MPNLTTAIETILEEFIEIQMGFEYGLSEVKNQSYSSKSLRRLGAVVNWIRDLKPEEIRSLIIETCGTGYRNGARLSWILADGTKQSFTMNSMQFIAVVAVGGIIIGSVGAGIYSCYIIWRQSRQLQQLRQYMPFATKQDLFEYQRNPTEFRLKKNLITGGEFTVEEILSQALVPNFNPGIKLIKEYCFNKPGVYIMNSKWYPIIKKALNLGLGTTKFIPGIGQVAVFGVDSFLAWTISNSEPFKIRILPFTNVELALFEYSRFKVALNLLTILTGTVVPVFRILTTVILFLSGNSPLNLAQLMMHVSSNLKISLGAGAAYGAIQFVPPICSNYARYIEGSEENHGVVMTEEYEDGNVFLIPEDDKAKFIEQLEVAHHPVKKPDTITMPVFASSIDSDSSMPIQSTPVKPTKSGWFSFRWDKNSASNVDINVEEMVPVDQCSKFDTPTQSYRFANRNSKKQCDTFQNLVEEYREVNNEMFHDAEILDKSTATNSPLFRRQRAERLVELVEELRDVF